MYIMDCIDWRGAAITAYRRYLDQRAAIPIMRAQLDAYRTDLASARPNSRDDSNTTQSRWIDHMDAARLLEHQLSEAQTFCSAMDAALETLPEVQRQVIAVRYGSGMSPGKAIQTIIDTLAYEKTKVYEILDQATRNLARLLYGAA